MTRPLRVFLCHASQDKPLVIELYTALKAEGWIDPWLDRAKILPGQDWEMVIEKAVDDSDVVVICLSKDSVSKEGFVNREIRYAYDLALEKPEDTIFLIPLRLNDCNVPRKLKTFHWADYFGNQKSETYSDLLKALKLRHEQKLEHEKEEIQRTKITQSPQSEVEAKVNLASKKIIDESLEHKEIQKTPTLHRNDFKPSPKSNSSRFDDKDRKNKEFQSDQSIFEFIENAIQNTEDFRRNLNTEYDATIYGELERRFINLRNQFKSKLFDISNPHNEFLNFTERRKASVEQIITCTSAVARKFQEARENNHLDRVSSIDALENLIYAMKNLLSLIDHQRT